jgi:hypothetical protein
MGDGMAHMKLIELLKTFVLAAGIALPAGASAQDTTGTQTATTETATLAPCGDLPVGNLSDADLEKLAPEGSPGKVRIGWKTESQEETYGFNITRADRREGPYLPINKSIIPGEGTTNVPKAYCYEDTGVKRGETYYYQIEEITNSGVKTIVDGTEGTMVKVKTVQEERDWLKKKAADAAAAGSQ